MLDESLVRDIIAQARTAGADLAELYAERWRRRGIRVLNGETKEATSGLEYGAGIRLFYGTEIVYGYTNDLTREGVRDLTTTLTAARGQIGRIDVKGRGKSPLAGRLGERIASPLVTIVDDPTMLGGLLSRPFDDEGTPTRSLALVERGILRGFLHNSETAHALNSQNTGHAFCRYNGVLTVSSTNTALRPGSGAAMGQGVLVTEVIGAHAGANYISGEFSVQGLGLWVEGGETTYPVENFAVAGDFLSLLNDITALGETLQWEFGMMGGAFGAPLVAVAGLSFAGT
jgi:predicted Zn-dependent protease